MTAFWLTVAALAALAVGGFVCYMVGFSEGARDGWRRGWQDRGEY